ncbi:YL1 nuclear protein-domain-containing protein [Gymnopilus junonius]|uniref:YL1 nuclear protein-domain-containing protein n=1 Tax=Gymnopilus junonius TaxID=109634 RepID=A0A9P5NLD3_GYMJU|nr:YL1 nuclear protein-domain-containing protein [Gymnopilus junonius]
MEEQHELLATRRSKRSTAGNRMEAALAEMALDDVVKDMEDDNDFVNDKGMRLYRLGMDEEEVTQIEAAVEAEAINEERRNRKAARSRLDKITAAAHQKHKSTFNPDIQLSSPADKLKMSKRRHTVLNTSATVTRIKQSEAKKASQPKKAKLEYKKYTQAELIAHALDTEEGNIIEHRDYLKNEDEKRKRARVVRTTTEGPLLRWVSRIEQNKVQITPPPPPQPPRTVAPLPPVTPFYRRSVYGLPGSLFTPTTSTYSGGTAMTNSGSAPSASSQIPTIFQHYQGYLNSASSPFPMWLPPSPSPALQQQTSQPQLTTLSTTTLTPFPSPQVQAVINAELPPPREPEYKMVTVMKNYVVHELAQQRGAPRPTWTQNMGAMSGDHVKWDEVKVYVGKNRPLGKSFFVTTHREVNLKDFTAHHKHTCPITGRQAHYLDPRSGVPYADSHAYKILTRLLAHEYIWSATAGCYLNYEKPPAADPYFDDFRKDRLTL